MKTALWHVDAKNVAAAAWQSTLLMIRIRMMRMMMIKIRRMIRRMVMTTLQNKISLLHHSKHKMN